MFTLFIYQITERLLKPNKSTLVHQSQYFSVDDARRAWEDYSKNNPTDKVNYYHIIDANGKHWEP